MADWVMKIISVSCLTVVKTSWFSFQFDLESLLKTEDIVKTARDLLPSHWSCSCSASAAGDGLFLIIIFTNWSCGRPVEEMILATDGVGDILDINLGDKRFRIFFRTTCRSTGLTLIGSINVMMDMFSGVRETRVLTSYALTRWRVSLWSI